MKEKKLVVFDMDGTLNRIELFIIPTYKEVLQKFAGAQADDDTVMRLMGCVDEQIYQGLLPGAPMERFDEFMALTAEAEYLSLIHIFAGLGGKISYALEGSVFVGGAVIQWVRDQLRFVTCLLYTSQNFFTQRPRQDPHADGGENRKQKAGIPGEKGIIQKHEQDCRSQADSQMCIRDRNKTARMR